MRIPKKLIKSKKIIMSENKNYSQALSTLVTVFFFWGFIAASNGVFIPFCKEYFMIDQFQSENSSPVLLISLKAGGTGLNLTAANRVIHFDRWWNPAVEDQATDRAWRIGQQRTVFVHKLVCQGTLEEKINTLLIEKRELASQSVGTGDDWFTNMDTDELKEMFSLNMSKAVQG